MKNTANFKNNIKKNSRPFECNERKNGQEQPIMPGREACVVKAAPSEENIVLHGRNESKEDIKKRKIGKPVSAIVCFLEIE